MHYHEGPAQASGRPLARRGAAQTALAGIAATLPGEAAPDAWPDRPERVAAGLRLLAAWGDVAAAARAAEAPEGALRAILNGYGARAVLAAARDPELTQHMAHRPSVADLPRIAEDGCEGARRLLGLPGVRQRAEQAARLASLVRLRDPLSERRARAAAGEAVARDLTALYLGDPAPGRSALEKGADGRCMTERPGMANWAKAGSTSAVDTSSPRSAAQRRSRMAGRVAA